MIFSSRALRMLPIVIAVLLSACGGGQASTPVIATQTRTGQPDPAALDTTAFVAMARLEDCREMRNKLYVIDNRMVLSDRIGNCPDNAYAHELYGATTDNMLCYEKQYIGGGMSSCKDPTAFALFDTIRKNLDKADLGLGSSHSVKEVHFLPRDGSAVAFEILFNAASSSIATPKQVVVRDATAFADLWKQHGANASPAPVIPTVDFNTQMVIGLFAGTSHGCHIIYLQRLTVSGDKLVAEYFDSAPVAVCIAAQTAPMHLAIVKRVDAEVEFKRVAP